MRRIIITVFLCVMAASAYSNPLGGGYTVVDISSYIENGGDLPDGYELVFDEYGTQVALKKTFAGGESQTGPEIQYYTDFPHELFDEPTESPVSVNLTFRVSRIYNGPNGPEVQIVLRNSEIYTTYNKFYRKDFGSVRPVEIIDNAVHIKGYFCSSFLQDDIFTHRYDVLSMFDGDPETGWSEGASGPGIGEFFTVDFKETLKADRFSIMAGWFQKKYYSRNNRVRRIKVEAGGGTFYFDLEDVMEPQVLSFGKTIEFSKFTLYIEDVYEGSDWDDTPISEIMFYSGNNRISCFYDATEMLSYYYFYNSFFNF